jgi:hypothetical protein
MIRCITYVYVILIGVCGVSHLSLYKMTLLLFLCFLPLVEADL